MTREIVTSPTLYPVSLAEAKEQLDIYIMDTDKDSYINGLISMAVDVVERYTNRKLITQTWKVYLDEWPEDNYIAIPFGQLQSVTHVKYTDSDNDQTTWANTNYIVDTANDPGRVVLEYGESWPTATLYPSNPIEIQFVCGYGATASSVPDVFRHAIKLFVRDNFDNRGSNYVESFSVSHANTRSFESLLFPKKLYL